MNFNQAEFNNLILDNGILGFFENPITLKSGRKSNWYVNWRNAANDPELLDFVTKSIIKFALDHNLDPHCFYGVPEGATKFGVISSFRLGKITPPDYGPRSIPMGRGKPKDHGDPKDRYFVGAPAGRTVVIEDVTTTGGSLISTLENLSEIESIEVVAAIGLTNRMELNEEGISVEQAVANKGFTYLSMSNAIDLLPEAYKRLKPGQDIGKAIVAEFEDHGVEKLVLEV